MQVLSNSRTEQDPGCMRINLESQLKCCSKCKKEWVSDKFRHVKTSHHFFFKHHVDSGDIELSHITGPTNCADIFTRRYGEGDSSAGSRFRVLAGYSHLQGGLGAGSN